MFLVVRITARFYLPTFLRELRGLRVLRGQTANIRV